MSTLNIETRPVADLKPYANNPRTHSKKQIQQIAESIKIFGWTNPILVDDADCIIAGHGRLEAAKLLDLAEVPVIRLSAMSPAQKRAYIIADNKLAENAGWDDEILAIELRGLLEMDLDFSIETIGFETAEIDLLLVHANQNAEPEQDIPAPSAGPATTRIGDLWLLGRHRLFCGDALDEASYSAVLGSERANAVFTDPPYNVPIDGHVCGKGAITHAEFVMASGEMSESEFSSFLQRICENLVAFSYDGSMHFICMDWRHIFELLCAGREHYAELKNICVWNKTNGGMGSLYRSKHELVCVFKNGAAPHVNNVELDRFGRNRTNVWDYAGVNSFGAARLDDLEAHPTVKPAAMIADAILDVTRRDDLVLDPFCGSGSTILAAEQTGRRVAAIELDPNYVDVAIKRFEQASGENTVLAATGISFTETKIDRAFERALA
jgi:DNA modification methylase